ncbi:glycosyl hydrolase family 61 [Colletotrichum tofieldiae]|uniref:lytic cellulose monooxygenase (C4-dehydrogenating) n=1 Tax=Colletotrichum tofieldiae TaxID=708197 RepID=A0A166N475_9PEZI|nr:glycosyl hydrolase family 61 [Colletotrichum tofieldiae]GKT86021.1 glycosyl hydrolase family 61 protein [Colletotrichum tofieldiae]
MHSIHLAVAIALAAQTYAHGILGEVVTNGVRHATFQTDYIYRKQNGNPTPDLIAWSTESLDRGYIEPSNMDTLDINCHVNAEPGVLTAQVAAGGKVDFFWPDWPHDVSPVLTYIAPCGGDCASADKSALKWTKIDEAGYDGQWAAAKLIANNFTWTTPVPSTIAPGNYVFRNEIINLHSGAEQNGAQLYPQCVNIEITGTGTDTPEGVLGVELYKADDAGILFDPYAKGMSTYPIPGPALYVAGKPASAPTESVSSYPTQSDSAPSSVVTAVTPAAASATPPAVPTTLSTRTRALGSRTRTLGSHTRTLGLEAPTSI